MTRPSLIAWLGAGLSGLALAGLLSMWTPSDDPADSICVLRRTTGLSCPGCGFTRASVHLAKGEWTQAAVEHPLAPVLAAEALLGWLAWGTVLLGKLAPPPDRLWSRLLLAHFAAFGAVWVARLVMGILP